MEERTCGISPSHIVDVAAWLNQEKCKTKEIEHLWKGITLSGSEYIVRHISGELIQLSR